MARLAASTALLLFIFTLSIVTFVVAVKYIEWSIPQALASEHLPLVFYAGTMPLASMLQTSVHIAILHLEAILPASFVALITAMQTVGWLAVGSIWTHCESSDSPTPGLCPQALMFHQGKDGLMGLAVFKDISSLVLALAYATMFVLSIKHVRERSKDTWKDREEFLVLADYETRPV